MVEKGEARARWKRKWMGEKKMKKEKGKEGKCIKRKREFV